MLTFLAQIQAFVEEEEIFWLWQATAESLQFTIMQSINYHLAPSQIYRNLFVN